MPNNQIVTFTLFRFNGWQRRWWAFRQMGLSPWLLKGIPGMQFGKMLGSGGGNGFRKTPHFGVYGLLCVWEHAAAADDFLNNHVFFRKMTTKATEHWTVFLHTCAVHGKWDGLEPFEISKTYQEGKPLAVLTRATIRTQYLWHFWRFVPPVSRSITQQNGLLFSIGIGELPIVQQATFSLWESSHSMKAYAYQSPHHSAVVKKTRQLGWYKEELFARFIPYATQGSWEGKNPLEKYSMQID